MREITISTSTEKFKCEHAWNKHKNKHRKIKVWTYVKIPQVQAQKNLNVNMREYMQEQALNFTTK